jgi:hypothetical protein
VASEEGWNNQPFSVTVRVAAFASLYLAPVEGTYDATVDEAAAESPLIADADAGAPTQVVLDTRG